MKSLQGIFGGTFDPIHNGHLQLIETLLQKTALQSIRIIPCHIPAHRPSPHATASQRLDMLKLATTHLQDKIIIDEYELQRNKISYSIHTIEYLKKTHPDTEFVFIMGEDAWNSFPTWHRYKDILKQVSILVIARKNSSADIAPTEFKSEKVPFFKEFHSPVSSTLVREQLSQQQDCSAYLPKAVYDYILTNHLY